MAGSAIGPDADVLLAKVDCFGNVLWSRTYGWEYEDEATSLVNTSDGDLSWLEAR